MSIVPAVLISASRMLRPASASRTNSTSVASRSQAGFSSSDVTLPAMVRPETASDALRSRDRSDPPSCRLASRGVGSRVIDVSALAATAAAISKGGWRSRDRSPDAATASPPSIVNDRRLTVLCQSSSSRSSLTPARRSPPSSTTISVACRDSILTGSGNCSDSSNSSRSTADSCGSSPLSRLTRKP